MSAIRLGFFLAVRQIFRGNPWTTILIVFVMVLTFLNLVVIGGILVGLPEGASLSLRTQYTGDVIFKTFPTEDAIDRSVDIVQLAKSLPDVTAVSPRYLSGGMAESNYRIAVAKGEDPDKASAVMVGVDPGSEDQVTGLSHLLLEGSYLTGDDDGMVLLGKNLLSQYTVGGFFSDTLKDVHVGTKIRVMIGDIKKEVTVKGIVGSKVADVSNRIFFVDRELRNLLGRTDFRVNEIAVRIRPDATAESVRDVFLGNGFGDVAIVQTFRESEGTFLDQIRQTFTLLGGVIGGIALVVASITIFIVIFINAVTRRKYIGIMKGIGIAPLAIEISYVLQSVFYALAGSVLGLGILYGFIQPYFDKNPIDFPFADGLLLAPIEDTLLKMAILIFATVIAGYAPARMIISKNTLDSILGRTS